MLAIKDGHRPVCCLEVIEQAGIDGDSTGLAVPLSIGFERRTIGIQVAATGAAEVVRHELRIPPVDSVAVGLRSMELVRFKVRVEMTAL